MILFSWISTRTTTPWQEPSTNGKSAPYIVDDYRSVELSVCVCVSYTQHREGSTHTRRRKKESTDDRENARVDIVDVARRIIRTNQNHVDTNVLTIVQLGMPTCRLAAGSARSDVKSTSTRHQRNVQNLLGPREKKNYIQAEMNANKKNNKQLAVRGCFGCYAIILSYSVRLHPPNCERSEFSRGFRQTSWLLCFHLTGQLANIFLSPLDSRLCALLRSWCG